MTKMLANVSLLIVLFCSSVQASQVQEKPESLRNTSNITDVAGEALIVILVLTILDRFK